MLGHYNAETLKQYIENNFNGSQAAFARVQGVKPQQVTQWIDKEFIVVCNTLYSRRRNLVIPKD